LTPAQVAAVKKGYAMLEQDVLEGFVAQQLSVLTSELDLNEFQSEEVEKLLSKDLRQKRIALVGSRAHPGSVHSAHCRDVGGDRKADPRDILSRAKRKVPAGSNF
jgi:hypothetical protein